MSDEVGEYQKISIKQFPARDIRESAEERYWRRFKAPVTTQEVGAVTHIDFKQQRPHHFAVTASTRVLVYDAHTRKLNKTVARFKDIAYCGTFRQDGELLLAGGEDGVVQIFQLEGRTVLRQLKGHQRAVRVAAFSPDKIHVLTCGDDATVRYWDITTGDQVLRLDGHTDYIRAAAVNPANSSIWATGGYDHQCIVWNVESGEALMKLDHGSPIEAVAYYPSGAMLVTAGGAEIRIWDVLAGGKLVARLTNFQKTVTCICLSPVAGPDSEASSRLLAGSLDGHVRIFELEGFKLTHSSKYPGGVLSLALSLDCRLLAVGLADGTLSVRRHARKRPPGVPADASWSRRKGYKPKLTAANYHYFVRGASEKAGPGDLVIASRKAMTLRPYDKMLRQFRYRDALDAALVTHQPFEIISVLEELIIRNGLNICLSGRDEPGLLLVLHFISKNIHDPRYTLMLVHILHRLLDMYVSEIAESEAALAKVKELRQKLRGEVRLNAMLLRLQGSLEPVLAAALL